MTTNDQISFKPLRPQDLSRILGLTIKKDEENKVVTFLCQLSAYSENAQFNESFNAPSSTGKSYIPLETADLFPQEDVMKLGNCSPTAFFHEQGAFNKETNVITVDLSRKIIIFLDQPHNALLERLRSLLSHDQKEMQSKITDKNQKGGNRTKTVIIRGYPSVIFCSASMQIDEQEATRFFLLSPEASQEKIREAVRQKIAKESDNAGFRSRLDEDPERRLLKERILAIRNEKIGEINIANPKDITERFLGQRKFMKPRHQRDVGRLLALVKAFSLLNLWWRERDGTTLTANSEDVEAAFGIWDKISLCQEMNLPPYVYKLYDEVILPAWEEKRQRTGDADGQGLTRQEILKQHYEVYGRMMDGNQLRQQILPVLVTAGLISQEPHPIDRRKMLIYPTVPLNTSPSKRNSDGECGATETVQAAAMKETA